MLGVFFYFSLVDRARVWKWTSICLRGGAIALLLLSICKPFSTGDVEDLHVVFLVDTSASVSDAGIDAALHSIAEGIESLDTSDTYSLLRFDKELRSTTKEELEKLRQSIVSDGGDSQLRAGTDLASALLTLRMEFHSDKAKKVVILSDGVTTSSGLESAIRSLESEGVVIEFSKIARLQTTEVAVTSFKSNVNTAFEGEIVRLEGVIASNKEMDVTARLLHKGVEVKNESLKLLKDTPLSVGFDVEMFSAGNSRWSLEVEPAEDYFPMNNKMSTIIQVSGKPRVLAIHKEPTELRPLARALRTQGIELDVRGVKGLPSSLAEMIGYRAILLCNVPATDLTINQLIDLKRYVADSGGGLAMIGSENSFGIGGYYNTPVDEILPVVSRYEKEKIKPSLAMVLVIDKSGSMQGQPIALARQAAKSAVELLASQDSVALIGFDSNAQTIVPMSSAANKASIKDSIDSLMANGGTNLYPGMLRAQEMLDSTPAKIKHMIILSDGQTAGSDYQSLTEDIVATGVTISTVALGEGAAKDLMKALAAMGKGRYYETNDPQTVPQIFTKETMQASKSAIKEDLYSVIQVADHPMMNGFEKTDLPYIMGYVMTKSKATAKVILSTELGDPLLAVNRFGLGQTFVYTSDLTEKWGSEWLGWSSFGPFWNQVIRTVLRKEDGGGIQLQTSTEDENLTIGITRKDDAGNLINQVAWKVNTLNNSSGQEMAQVDQVGIGKYKTTLSLLDQERVMVQVRDAADGKMKTIYWQRPYPKEFQLTSTIDEALSSKQRTDFNHLRSDVTVGEVKKDRMSWFGIAAIFMAIASVFFRRI